MNRKLRVLVACEYSGTVRDAFIALGHEAVSCDLLPTDTPGPHYQGDVLNILDEGWDIMIAHPPCTFLSVSGIHWNDRGRGWGETNKALDFVRALLDAPIPHIALENPVSIISSRIRKPDQIIHPHQFGHDASKATCLWLKDLPHLIPTKNFPPRIVGGKKRWGNQTDSGQNKLGPSEDRWKIRSTTYQGIAAAMAAQWSEYVSSLPPTCPSATAAESRGARTAKPTTRSVTALGRAMPKTSATRSKKSTESCSPSDPCPPMISSSCSSLCAPGEPCMLTDNGVCPHAPRCIFSPGDSVRVNSGLAYATKIGVTEVLEVQWCRSYWAVTVADKKDVLWTMNACHLLPET